MNNSTQAKSAWLGIIAWLGASLCGLAADLPLESVNLSTLPPESATQGWGTLQTDKAVAGTPLSIGGHAFVHGLGTHANSEIVYQLEGQYETFSAWVGVDDNLKNHPEASKASIVFRVFGDGRMLFDSGVMRMGNPAKPVIVPVAGISELKLVVTDAGDGNNCDHADWAEAVLLGKHSEDRFQRAEPKYAVRAPGLTVRLDKMGNLVDCLVGDKHLAWPLAGQTWLSGCRVVGEVAVKKTGGGCAFTRRLADMKGHACAVTERFTPTRDSIHWEVEIAGEGAPWTKPIVSRLQCANPDQYAFWTAWSDPQSKQSVLLEPKEEARLLNGQVRNTAGVGDWMDPLELKPFATARWYYGSEVNGVPTGHDFITTSLATLVRRDGSRGVSWVLSPDDVLLNLRLNVSASGELRFTRTNHRLGGGKPVKFSMDLVPHEAGWRGGLRWMAAKYPNYFNPKLPLADEVAGCGAYSGCEAKIDVAKYQRMAFRFNWKLSDDFPYMGQFIPVKTADESWIRSCDEDRPPAKKRDTSCRGMNDYARWMRDHGFHVLSYFNVTEFGKNMQDKAVDPAQKSDPELWKDPVAFAKLTFPKGLLWPPIGTCYGAWVTDPGDPDYAAFMLEQAERHIRLLPDTSGICIDRCDWFRYYNPDADDGVSFDGRISRSLYQSWRALGSRLGPLMHQAGKIIYVNPHPMRQDLLRDVDGIYTEFGQDPGCLNALALQCIRMPAIAWTYNATPANNPDDYFQRCLYLGVFPTAPYPNNNHCITPEPGIDKFYLDYGPLLEVMRGKKWVLEPHCIECATPGVKVNLFQVYGGYALPTVFGGDEETAIVRIRNLDGLAKMKCEARHPGAEAAVRVPATFKTGVLELKIPLKRGCAMVKMAAP